MRSNPSSVSTPFTLYTDNRHLLNLPQTRNFMLGSSKLKEFADDDFKFDENERFSKTVENTVRKEKLLVTSDFSFSNNVFKRLVMQTRKTHEKSGEGGLLWERFNTYDQT